MQVIRLTMSHNYTLQNKKHEKCLYDWFDVNVKAKVDGVMVSDIIGMCKDVP